MVEWLHSVKQVMWKGVKWWKIGEELLLYHCISKTIGWHAAVTEGLAC